MPKTLQFRTKILSLLSLVHRTPILILPSNGTIEDQKKTQLRTAALPIEFINGIPWQFAHFLAYDLWFLTVESDGPNAVQDRCTTKFTILHRQKMLHENGNAKYPVSTWWLDGNSFTGNMLLLYSFVLYLLLLCFTSNSLPCYCVLVCYLCGIERVT